MKVTAFQLFEATSSPIPNPPKGYGCFPILLVHRNFPKPKELQLSDQMISIPFIRVEPSETEHIASGSSDSDDLHLQDDINSSPHSKNLIPPIDPSSFDLMSFSLAQLAYINNVIRSHDLTIAKTLREQVRIMCEVLRADEVAPICSYAKIAKMFRVRNAQTIRNQFKATKKTNIADGRPSLFSDKVKDFIYQIIHERYKASDPIGTHERIDFLMETFGIAVSLDALRHFIYRDKTIKIIQGQAMESRRVEIDFHEIKKWYDDLGKLIKSIPRNFIFNMDESGIDEYVDQQNIYVLVPKDHDGKSVPIPVHRQIKRAILTACISAAGDSLKPFVILPRGSLDEDLFYAG
jgi:hypothetical protein